MYLELDDFRSVISEEIQENKYDDLQAKYGINRFYLWHIIHEPEYEPPAWVYAHLGIAKYELARACSACGAVHAYDRACEMQVTVRPKPAPRKASIRWGWLWDVPDGDLQGMIIAPMEPLTDEKRLYLKELYG